jgi:uncharacterized membrane protein
MRVWARGFEEFVDRVERERIEASERRRVFETLLPYAMALGVGSRWARHFEDIYTAENRPSWFVAPHHGVHFSTRALEQSLANTVSPAMRQMAASPRSSGGSGGGGFSGGGGGGGGGGSW